MSAPVRTAVAADDWAPVHDALLAGVVHACNNRVAALGAIVQLQESGLATPDEGIEALTAEVRKLREMMELLRALMLRPGTRKEPQRFGDALRGAAALLAHHITARQWKVSIADEAPDAEPVLLFPSDPIRLAVLALLATGAGAPAGELRVTVLRNGRYTDISIVADTAVAAVEARAEFAALARAAEREGGSVRCRAYAGEGSAKLTLALPGLSAASPGR